jgi:hypothetical protein
MQLPDRFIAPVLLLLAAQLLSLLFTAAAAAAAAPAARYPAGLDPHDFRGLFGYKVSCVLAYCSYSATGLGCSGTVAAVRACLAAR